MDNIEPPAETRKVAPPQMVQQLAPLRNLVAKHQQQKLTPYLGGDELTEQEK